MQAAPDTQEEFDFFVKFVKPLVLSLPKSNDRVKAASWIQKLRTVKDPNRNDYLKLLMFVLHRRELIGVFAENPEPGNQLQPLPENMDLMLLARNLISTSREMGGGGEPPPYSVEVSADQKEYAVSQSIPKFGTHFIYAVSKQPISEWINAKYGFFPKGQRNFAVNIFETTSPSMAAVPAKGFPNLDELEERVAPTGLNQPSCAGSDQGFKWLGQFDSREPTGKCNKKGPEEWNAFTGQEEIKRQEQEFCNDLLNVKNSLNPGRAPSSRSIRDDNDFDQTMDIINGSARGPAVRASVKMVRTSDSRINITQGHYIMTTDPDDHSVMELQKGMSIQVENDVALGGNNYDGEAVVPEAGICPATQSELDQQLPETEAPPMMAMSGNVTSSPHEELLERFTPSGPVRHKFFRHQDKGVEERVEVYEWESNGPPGSPEVETSVTHKLSIPLGEEMPDVAEEMSRRGLMWDPPETGEPGSYDDVDHSEGKHGYYSSILEHSSPAGSSELPSPCLCSPKSKRRTRASFEGNDSPCPCSKRTSNRRQSTPARTSPPDERSTSQRRQSIPANFAPAETRYPGLPRIPRASHRRQSTPARTSPPDAFFPGQPSTSQRRQSIPANFAPAETPCLPRIPRTSNRRQSTPARTSPPDAFFPGQPSTSQRRQSIPANFAPAETRYPGLPRIPRASHRRQSTPARTSSPAAFYPGQPRTTQRRQSSPARYDLPEAPYPGSRRTSQRRQSQKRDPFIQGIPQRPVDNDALPPESCPAKAEQEQRRSQRLSQSKQSRSGSPRRRRSASPPPAATAAPRPAQPEGTGVLWSVNDKGVYTSRQRDPPGWVPPPQYFLTNKQMMKLKYAIDPTYDPGARTRSYGRHRFPHEFDMEWYCPPPELWIQDELTEPLGPDPMDTSVIPDYEEGDVQGWDWLDERQNRQPFDVFDEEETARRNQYFKDMRNPHCPGIPQGPPDNETVYGAGPAEEVLRAMKAGTFRGNIKHVAEQLAGKRTWYPDDTLPPEPSPRMAIIHEEERDSQSPCTSPEESQRRMTARRRQADSATVRRRQADSRQVDQQADSRQVDQQADSAAARRRAYSRRVENSARLRRQAQTDSSTCDPCTSSRQWRL